MKSHFIFFRNSTVCMMFVLCGLFTSAQDFHLSQYDAAPMYLNPSMTGMFNGHYRLHGHYRTQWNAIANKPFRTAAISFDMPVKKFAFGAQIMHNRAGTGDFSVFSLLLSGAYDLNIDANNDHHISMGVQGGFLQKSVDINKLTWDNQYTYDNGGTFDTGLPSGENFTTTAITLPDLNAGLTYYYARESSRINPFLGFAVMHITQPSESFFGIENKLPIRYVLHGGVKVNINERLQILPKFFKMDQINDNELTVSLIGHYYLKGFDAHLIFGTTFRNYLTKDLVQVNKDAMIFELGAKYTRYTVIVSYDINTSSLKPATSGRGGFEISLTYIPSKLKPNPVPNCPRL